MTRVLWLDYENRRQLGSLASALRRLGRDDLAFAATGLAISGAPQAAAELYLGLRCFPQATLDHLPIWANRAGRPPATTTEE